MNCEKVRSKLSALSADTLSSGEANNILTHLGQCPSCQQQWSEYQDLFFLISAIPQPIPAAQQSQQMWAYCQQRITENEINHRYASQQHAPLPQHVAFENSNPLLSWFGLQPRWGWIAVGGALAALAGAWFASAPAPQRNTPTTNTAQFFPSNSGTVQAPLPAANTSLDLPSPDPADPSVFEAPPMPPAYSEHNPITVNSAQPYSPANSGATHAVLEP